MPILLVHTRKILSIHALFILLIDEFVNVVDNNRHFEKILLVEIVRTIWMVDTSNCLLFLATSKDHAVNLFITV